MTEILLIVTQSKSIEIQTKSCAFREYTRNPIVIASLLWQPMIFTADDQSVLSSDDERKEVVNLDLWLKKPEIVYSCKCQEVLPTGYMYSRSVNVRRSYVSKVSVQMDKFTGGLFCL